MVKMTEEVWEHCQGHIMFLGVGFAFLHMSLGLRETLHFVFST